MAAVVPLQRGEEGGSRDGAADGSEQGPEGGGHGVGLMRSMVNGTICPGVLA